MLLYSLKMPIPHATSTRSPVVTSDACKAILDRVANVSGVFAWVLQIDAGQAKHRVFLQNYATSKRLRRET